MIKNGLKQTENIDYYPTTTEFESPYTLKANNETLTSEMIFLSLGSRPFVPNLEGLEETGYLTSDTIIKLTHLPESIAIIGGGYVAAEYGHFLSGMGCKVTIIGRNRQFIPEEEAEISSLLKKELQKRLTILTGHEVRKTQKARGGKKLVIAVNTENKQETEVVADEIFVAVGRKSNADLLHPEKAGIKTNEKGFISVNEYLETTQPNIWAMGDANGKFMFKHVANYESQIVYFNAILKNKISVDYHAVPHAVFTEPEIASVGLKESEAIAKYGKENVVIGFQKFADTAKGEAMALGDEFVKVILEREKRKIIGGHIIGPQASVLIQEIINLMYTSDQSSEPLTNAMHIHPSLSEVVSRAFSSLMSLEQYHHILQEHMSL